MCEVEGRTALVTGGSSGIGLGLAKALAEAGAKVAITYRREDRRDAAIAALEATCSRGVHAVRLDVTDRSGWAAALAQVEDVLGPVSILCNNAGVGLTGPAEVATHDDWDWVLGANLGGTVNGIVTLIPRLIARRSGGHIVNTASFAGLVATLWAAPYITSKFAVVGLSEALRTDLYRYGIGVSAFCPGPVKSNIADSASGRPPHLSNTGYTPELYERLFGDAPPVDDSAWMEPEEAGRRVVEGIRRNDMYILTHPELRGFVDRRSEALAKAWPLEPHDNVRLASVAAIFANGIYQDRAPMA